MGSASHEMIMWGGYTAPVQMDEISGCADICVRSYAMHAMLGCARSTLPLAKYVTTSTLADMALY